MGLAADQPMSALMDVLADPEQLKQRLASLQDAEHRAAAQITTAREQTERITADCKAECNLMRSSAEASAQGTIQEANVIKANASKLMLEAQGAQSAAIDEQEVAKVLIDQQNVREAEVDKKADELTAREQAIGVERRRVRAAVAKIAEVARLAQQDVG